MLKSLRHQPVLLFLLKAFGLYVLWYILYEIWLHPQGKMDLLLIDNLIFLSSGILELLGFRLIEQPLYNEAIRTMGIDGSHGVWIGDPCNGLTLFALFTGFIIAYPGPLIRKLIYIPIGIIIIHFMNVLRIVSLSVITLYAPEYLEINHTYTFTILVYTCVFILWIIWTNKFSKTKITG